MEWGRCICKSCITVQTAGERSAEEDVFCICTGVTLITQQIHFKYKTNFQLNSNKSPTYLGFAPNKISLLLKLKHCCLCLWGAINAASHSAQSECNQLQLSRQLKRNWAEFLSIFVVVKCKYVTCLQLEHTDQMCCPCCCYLCPHWDTNIQW